MKVFKLLLIAIIVLLLAAGVIWAKQYYDNRYAIEDYYYTAVPLDYDFTPTMSYSTDGEPMGLESNYRLFCYNAEGEARELEFRVSTSMHDLYPPGTFVKVGASKLWATGKHAVPETDVPEKALEKINYTPSSASTLTEYAAERTRLLKTRAYPVADVSCDANETDLIYTYVYGTTVKESALRDVESLDWVYRSQFRTDKDMFPELAAIHLIVELNDGTEIFSRKYDKIVRFGYEEE